MASYVLRRMQLWVSVWGQAVPNGSTLKMHITRKLIKNSVTLKTISKPPKLLLNPDGQLCGRERSQAWLRRAGLGLGWQVMPKASASDRKFWNYFTQGGELLDTQNIHHNISELEDVFSNTLPLASQKLQASALLPNSQRANPPDSPQPHTHCDEGPGPHLLGESDALQALVGDN